MTVPPNKTRISVQLPLAGVTAAGNLAASIGTGATSMTILVTSTCPFAVTGSSGSNLPGDIVVGGTDVGPALAVSPLSAGQQVITLAAMSSAHVAAESVVQDDVPKCRTGSTYVSLAPARILDTRNGTGLSGTFTSTVPRSLQVTGVGGVPSGAIAVTGNLTVTNQTSPGYAALTTVSDPGSLHQHPQLPARRQPGQRGDRTLGLGRRPVDHLRRLRRGCHDRPASST